MEKILSLMVIMLFMLYNLSSGQEEQYPPDSKPASTNVQNAPYLRGTAGINSVVFYKPQGTAHEWLTWRRSLYEFAQLLFNK